MMTMAEALKRYLDRHNVNYQLHIVDGGGRKVDAKRLSAVVGVPKIKIATPEITKMLTGFEVGVIPPLGHEKRLMTVIDRKVMDLGKVYGGSGAMEALIEINPKEIVRLTGAKAAEISE